MRHELEPLLSADLIEEDSELTAVDLCQLCRLSVEELLDMVEEGIVEPQGGDVPAWRFAGASLRRVRCAVQLRRDLGVNWAGAALALELLDELQLLRARQRHFDG